MKRFTHEDWRKSPIYEQELDAFLKTQTGQALLKTLDAITPKARGAAVHPNESAFVLGYISGHRDCLESIIALSAPLSESPAPVKATYAPENNDEDKP